MPMTSLKDENVHLMSCWLFELIFTCQLQGQVWLMLFDLPGMWLQDIQSQTSLHLAFGEGAVQAADWFLDGLTMEGIEIRVAFIIFGHIL